MVRSTRWLALAVGAALAASGGARAETPPLYGGEVVASFLGEPASLDPVLATTEVEVALVSLLFDTLYRIDESGQPVPHLAAAAPELAEDETSARIPLREGVRFHDGREMTAEDVARSIERARASAAGWLFSSIEAAWPDEGALVVELAAPAELAWLLAAPASAVTPGGRPPHASQPVGSGPFRLASLSRRRRVLEVRAFDRHFAGRPYVDRIAFRWYARAGEEPRRFEAGETHLSLRGDAAFAGSRPKYDTRVGEGAAVTLTYLGFGREIPEVADSSLRRAISLAIGRRGFRAIGAGERVIPAASPSPPELGGPAIEPARAWARPAEAEALVERAVSASPGLRALRGERAASIEVLVDASRPEDRLVAEKVVAALFRLGFRAHIAEAPARELARRARRGDCALYIGQLAAPVPSADITLAAALAAGRRAREAARLMSGVLDRSGALEAFEDSLPIVPLFHRSLRVHRRADVHGLWFDPAGRAQYADLFFFDGPTRRRDAR